MPPKIEVTSFEDGTDLEYTMALELMPDDPADRLLADRTGAGAAERRSGRRRGRLVASPTWRRRSSRRLGADRCAARNPYWGDVLVIDFAGKVDGEAIRRHGAAEDHHLELGSSQFIAGFEEQLIGARSPAMRKTDQRQLPGRLPQPSAWPVRTRGLQGHRQADMLEYGPHAPLTVEIATMH